MRSQIIALIKNDNDLRTEMVWIEENEIEKFYHFTSDLFSRNRQEKDTFLKYTLFQGRNVVDERNIRGASVIALPQCRLFINESNLKTDGNETKKMYMQENGQLTPYQCKAIVLPIDVAHGWKGYYSTTFPSLTMEQISTPIPVFCLLFVVTNDTNDSISHMKRLWLNENGSFASCFWEGEKFPPHEVEEITRRFFEQYGVWLHREDYLWGF